MKRIILLGLIPMITIVLFSCGGTTNDATNNTTPQKDTVKPESDADKVIKIADAGTKIIEDIHKDIKEAREIRQENKADNWVYKIGSPYEKEKLAAEAYDKIKSIPNIFVFKKERNEYYLVKDDGLSQDKSFGMRDSIEQLLSKTAGQTLKCEVVNLATECSSRRLPTTADPISYKVNRNKNEVQCKVCE